MKKYLNKGQGILEYTLLFGAVVAVLILVIFKPNGIQDKVKTAYDKTGNALEKATDDLTNDIFQ